MVTIDLALVLWICQPKGAMVFRNQIFTRKGSTGVEQAINEKKCFAFFEDHVRSEREANFFHKCLPFCSGGGGVEGAVSSHPSCLH